MNLTYFGPKMRRNMERTTQPTSDLSRHQKFIWEHHIWCHFKISEVATLEAMTLNFWCSLEVAATELHLCFVTKGNVWWKPTFLLLVTIAVLHHKHMKLFTLFTPHVIASTARKGFNQSIGRTKEQKTRLQCLQLLVRCRNLQCHQELWKAQSF